MAEAVREAIGCFKNKDGWKGYNKWINDKWDSLKEEEPKTAYEVMREEKKKQQAKKTVFDVMRERKEARKTKRTRKARI